MKSIKFIHTADLHLGSPLKSIGSVSGTIRKKLQHATFKALEKIIDAALKYEVDFVLFSGDVYDADSRSIQANRMLAEQLGRLKKKNIPAFLIGGNHDPQPEHGEDPIALPDNVVTFPSEPVDWEVITRKGTPVARVLGQSYRGRSDSRKMIKNYKAPDTNIWNIGMLHTGLEATNKKYVPCTIEDLKSQSSIHYWALGHIHKRQVLSEADPVIAYPGIPQGRDIGEAGLPGCLLVELFPRKKHKISLIPTSPILWLMQDCELDAKEGEPPETLDELVEIMNRQAREVLTGSVPINIDLPRVEEIDWQESLEGIVVRWRVTGRGALHDTLVKDRNESAEFLAQELNKRLGGESPFLWTESVQIHTGAPVPSLEELAAESNIFAEIAEIIAELEQADSTPAEVAKALGVIWDIEADQEALPPEKFLVTEELLTEFYQDVKLRVVEAILKKREST